MGAAGCLWSQDVPHRLELPPLGWKLGKLNYGPPVSMTVAQFQRGKSSNYDIKQEDHSHQEQEQSQSPQQCLSHANRLPRRDGRGKPNGCWPASCSDMGLPRRDDLAHGAGRRKDATGNPKVLRLGDKEK